MAHIESNRQVSAPESGARAAVLWRSIPFLAALLFYGASQYVRTQELSRTVVLAPCNLAESFLIAEASGAITPQTPRIEESRVGQRTVTTQIDASPPVRAQRIEDTSVQQARKGLIADASAIFRLGFATREIQDIRVGDRVLGRNPLREEVEEEAEPDSTWQVVELRMAKPSGKRLDIVLLRPQEWLEAYEVHSGQTIELSLPEMGAEGPAKVVSISDPTIQPGRGQVVTGTFCHEPDGAILNVLIAGLSEPIGCTSNHRFWSIDQQDFVPAEQLRVHESVATRALGPAAVLRVDQREKSERVYNLEIWGEHVYEIGPIGILVHNSYAATRIDKLVKKGVLVERGAGYQSGTTRYEWNYKGRQYLFDVNSQGQTVRAEGIWIHEPSNRRLSTGFLEGANGKRWNASHIFSREAGGPKDSPNFVKGERTWNQSGAWRTLELFLNKNAAGDKVVFFIEYRGPKSFVPSSITARGPGFRRIVDHP